jgi:glyoxylase-like metal-dependent hydrolase (beta-lactamase superfamily II)
MACTADVISIGTLSRNTFWGEKAAVRAPHATTTLIRDNGTTILVDPSVPAELMVHRLEERAGLRADQIDVVFLTSFLPVHRRSLALFENADWLIHETERSAMLAHLNRALEEVGAEGEVSPDEIEGELVLLGRTESAPDKLSRNVHLFPSPGVTPGTSGLLVAGPRTTVVAGDAIVTRDYHQNARVFERCADVEQARKSFAEILEVAEIVIPGHDNLIVTL